jgi:hypothetical protein
MKNISAPALLLAAALLAAQGATAAEDRWRFGIGTGFTSFSLDGKVGFATDAGGTIQDIDVSNSDAMDYMQSAFGLGGFASNGPWTISLSGGRIELDDSDSGLDVNWKNTNMEGSVAYNFATLGRNRLGVLAGVRYTKHEWDIDIAGDSADPEEDWTDVLIGVTHVMPFSEKWSWSNRVDYGFGDSEGTLNAVTQLNWRAFDHWTFNANVKFLNTEYGDKDDIDKSDFYYYDVDQPAFGLGFLYAW